MSDPSHRPTFSNIPFGSWVPRITSKPRFIWTSVIALVGLAAFNLPLSFNKHEDRIPLITVAHITTEHATFAQRLFEDLRSISQASNGYDLHYDELGFLSKAIRPFSSHVANNLAVASEHARRLRPMLHSPDYYVADRLFPIPDVVSALVKIIRLLQEVDLPAPILQDAKSRLAQEVDYWHTGLPRNLREVEGELNDIHEKCEIVAYQFEQVAPALPGLEVKLGLTPPPAWLWWKRRSWNRDKTVEQRRLWLAALSDSSKSVNRLCAAVEKTQEGLATYLDADIFQTLHLYPPVHTLTSTNSTLSEYLEYIPTPLKAMQDLVREAENRRPRL